MLLYNANDVLFITNMVCKYHSVFLSLKHVMRYFEYVSIGVLFEYVHPFGSHWLKLTTEGVWVLNGVNSYKRLKFEIHSPSVHLRLNTDSDGVMNFSELV